MYVVKEEYQTATYFMMIARLTPEEAALSNHDIICKFFPIPIYWGGEVIERRPGRKSGDTYIRVKLWKD